MIDVRTASQWEEIIATAKADGKAVIADFSAEWCGPCKQIGPYFVTLSEQFLGAIFVKIDVDENSEVAESCGISAMPTFQVYKDGALAEELVGASKEKLMSLVRKHAE